MAHLVFRWAAEAVSAKESDRSVAIAHPDAAVDAAVGILLGRYHQAGFTGESTAHLVVVQLLHKVSLLERLSPGTPPFKMSQAYFRYPPWGDAIRPGAVARPPHSAAGCHP